MGDANLVAVLVAILGSGGLTAVVTSIINSIRAAKRGVAVREDNRKEDIVKARNEAIKAADEADRVADEERARRIRWMEHAARQRVRLINAGIEPDPWPDDNPPSKESS